VQSAVAELVTEGLGEGTPGTAVPAGSSGPEMRPEPVSDPVDTGPRLTGIPVAPGLAVGEALRFRTQLPPAETHRVADPESEIRRLDSALERVGRTLDRLASDSLASAGEGAARMFEAQRLHLEDPAILDAVRRRILERAVDADSAWSETIDAMAERYRRLRDPLLRARGEDLIDVGERVRLALAGAESGPPRPERPAILCLDRLRPSDIPALDPDKVLGLCVQTGSRTSHAGILAGGLGIPVVFGLGAGLGKVADGREILVDGDSGVVDLAPDAETIAAARERRALRLERAARAAAIRHRPAVTRDGQRRCVAANMQGPQDLDAILDSGAEEVGLFRTEFLFMNRAEPPDEAEQFALYRQAVERLDGRSLTIRTLDVGADKPVPYLGRPAEANPSLGWRGLRYCLDSPDLFRTQLRAVLRASALGPVRLMFPMVSTLDEMLAARQALDAARRGLDTAGIAYDPKLPVGLMIEVPSAVEIAEHLAPHADFFSIGTNDLTQYLLACDRDNPRVQHLLDPLHPAVLRAIDRTVGAARRAGIRVAVCGGMAGDPSALPVLIGLGVQELSLSPSRIPELKLDLAQFDTGRCENLAQGLLQLATSAEVRKKIEAFLAARL